MEGGFVRTGRQQGDHPSDLPPATEVDDVAALTARVGPRRRLGDGMVAEARDQVGRLGCRRAVGEMDVRLQGLHPKGCGRTDLACGRCERADGHAQHRVNHDRQASTGENPLAARKGRCHGAPMTASPKRTPMAGGALLAGSILLGPVIGAFFGQPSIGLLAGFGFGLVLLLVVWLVDRRR